MSRNRFLGLCAAVLIGQAGCSQTPPRAGVGDFGVFTALHLLAAEASVDVEDSGDGTGATSGFGNGPFTSAEMKRYFESSPEDYEKHHERMDDFLDSSQRDTSVSQALQSKFTASLKLELAKALTAATQPAAKKADASTSTADGGQGGTASGGTGAAPATTGDATSGSTTTPSATTSASSGGGGGSTTPKSDATPPTVDADMKSLADQLVNSGDFQDSPFDRLDRVADFYAAYVVKNLRVRGDSRVIDSKVIREAIQHFADKTDPDFAKLLTDSKQGDPPSDRLILVIFQTHVEAGTMPDTWTGVRVQIMDGADDVKVIRLHPTRSYDVDRQTFAESNRVAASLSGSGSGNVRGLDFNAAADQETTNLARETQNYVSRISKVASFADASTHTIGFNFYPSNLKIQKRYVPFGALFQIPQYYVQGNLESGARDCAAILVVPREMKSFTCRVRQVYGSIDGGKVYPGVPVNDETSGAQGSSGWSQPFTVTLPPWDPFEQTAATACALPTTNAAAPTHHSAKNKNSHSKAEPTTKPAETQPTTDAQPPHPSHP